MELSGSIYITSCKHWSSTGRVCGPLHMDTSYSLVSCIIKTQENSIHVSIMEDLPMCYHGNAVAASLEHPG